MTACSLAAEKLLVGKGRFSDNAVVFIIDIEKVFVRRNKAGKHKARNGVFIGLANEWHQFYLESLLLCMLDIECRYLPYAVMEYFIGIQEKTVCMSGYNAEFIFRIPAVDIERGVGFGETKFLGFLQGQVIGFALVVHLCQDVICGAVKNAAQ